MALLRFCIVSVGLVVLWFFAHAADAQVSGYGSVALSSYGFSVDGDSLRYANDTASLIGGAFYNFPIQSRLTAGIDGRVLYGPALNGGVSATGALRIGFVPYHLPLRPYFEIGGGLVSATSNPGFDPQRYTNGALTLLGGLDIRITPTLDLRAVEYGVTAGSSNTSISSAVAFVDAGIVYHFRHSKKHN